MNIPPIPQDTATTSCLTPIRPQIVEAKRSNVPARDAELHRMLLPRVRFSEEWRGRRRLRRCWCIRRFVGGHRAGTYLGHGARGGSGDSPRRGWTRAAVAELVLELDLELEPDGNGTTVVSALLKVRSPVRTMRRRLGQCGSGHATSASVVIQSCGDATRCFAASKGSTAPRRRAIVDPINVGMRVH